jgi:hypothetical protein
VEYTAVYYLRTTSDRRSCKAGITRDRHEPTLYSIDSFLSRSPKGNAGLQKQDRTLVTAGSKMFVWNTVQVLRPNTLLSTLFSNTICVIMVLTATKMSSAPPPRRATTATPPSSVLPLMYDAKFHAHKKGVLFISIFAL